MRTLLIFRRCQSFHRWIHLPTPSPEFNLGNYYQRRKRIRRRKPKRLNSSYQSWRKEKSLHSFTLTKNTLQGSLIQGTESKSKGRLKKWTRLSSLRTLKIMHAIQTLILWSSKRFTFLPPLLKKLLLSLSRVLSTRTMLITSSPWSLLKMQETN